VREKELSKTEREETDDAEGDARAGDGCMIVLLSWVLIKAGCCTVDGAFVGENDNSI